MLNCASVMLPTGLPHCAAAVTTQSCDPEKSAGSTSTLRKRTHETTTTATDDDDDRVRKSPKKVRNVNVGEREVGVEIETEMKMEIGEKTDWEIEGFNQKDGHDALDMGAMLHPPENEDNDNDNWILRGHDDHDSLLNGETATEYFQLQETTRLINGAHEDDEDTALFSLPDININVAPELDIDIDIDLTPSLANLQQPSHSTGQAQLQVQVNSSTGVVASTSPETKSPHHQQQPRRASSSSNDNDNNNDKVLLSKSVAPPPFQWTTSNTTENNNIFPLINVSPPHIETRILAAAPQSTPRSSPIRILPRESKAGPKVRPQPSSSSHPKGSRASPSQFPGAQAPSNFFPLGPPAPVPAPTDPFALDPQKLNAALAGSVASAVQSPAALPVPHPMAGPLMFAQGFSPLPNHTSVGAPPTAMNHAGTAQSPHSPFVFVKPPNQDSSSSLKEHPTTTQEAVGLQQQNSMVYPPGVAPNLLPNQQGTVPVDPNTLMRMAQQMWYAAMAASGNPILPPQSMPTPNWSPFFANPAFLNPAAQNAAPFAAPQSAGSPPPAVPTNKEGNPVPAINLAHGKTRPIFITDDGKHVVVEQQAPAKLMKHPVLGRLQLATKQQPILSQAPTVQPAVEPTSDDKPPEAPPTSNPSNSNNSNSAPPPGESSAKDRRKRLVWTPELHERFVAAIGAVGIHQAVPKTLVQIMNVEGLTTEHVKSHLQKYRNQLRKNDDRDRDAEPSGARMIIKRMDQVGDGGREVRVLPNRNTTTAATNINMPANAPTKVRMLVKPQHGMAAETKKENKANAVAEGGPSAAGSNSNRSTPLATAKKNGLDAGGEGCTEDGEGMARVRMQKRTMDLQFQLQVMVHRTVALQKKLQVSIEKENTPKISKVVTATSRDETMAAAAPAETREEKKVEKESANLETEIQELNDEKEKVMAELGKLQSQIVEGKEFKGNKKKQ